MDIEINADQVTISPSNHRRVTVNLEGVELDDLIDAADQAVILDAIGREEVIAHFDITEASDEA